MADRPITISKEIEVTPEMVEAAVQVYWDSGISGSEYELESDKLIIKSMIESALRVESHCVIYIGCKLP